MLALQLASVFGDENDVDQALPSVDFETYYENALIESNVGKALPSLDYPGFGRYLWNDSEFDAKNNDKSLGAIGPYKCISTMHALWIEDVPAIFREFADEEDALSFQENVYTGLSIELRKAYGTPSNYYESLERIAEEWVGSETTVLLERTKDSVRVIHMKTQESS